jgi:hypothetical protein
MLGRWFPGIYDGEPMKKTVRKKLELHRETLQALELQQAIVGGSGDPSCATCTVCNTGECGSRTTTGTFAC